MLPAHAPGPPRTGFASCRRLLAAGLVALTIGVGACTGEEAVPIDELTTTTASPAGGHVLQSETEMRRLAEQQCRDDPELEQGEIRAVDPNAPDEILAVVTVDCATVE